MKIPYIYYRYLHSKIFQKFKGNESTPKEIRKFLYHWRIPEKLRPLIIKELEILGLIFKKGNKLKIERPTIYEENINDYYKEFRCCR